MSITTVICDVPVRIKCASIHSEQFIIVPKFPDPTTYSSPLTLASHGYYTTNARTIQTHQGWPDDTPTPCCARPIDPLPSIRIPRSGSSTGILLRSARIHTCSSRKPPLSHTMQEDTHMSQAFTLKNRSKLGRRCTALSFVRSQLVLRCVIIDHRRSPCQGILYCPPAVGTGSYRRHRCPRERGPVFAMCLCILHPIDRQVKVTPCIDRVRDRRLYRWVCKSSQQCGLRCWVRWCGDTWRKWLPRQPVPSGNFQ